MAATDFAGRRELVVNRRPPATGLDEQRAPPRTGSRQAYLTMMVATSAWCTTFGGPVHLQEANAGFQCHGVRYRVQRPT